MTVTSNDGVRVQPKRKSFVFLFCCQNFREILNQNGLLVSLVFLIFFGGNFQSKKNGVGGLVGLKKLKIIELFFSPYVIKTGNHFIHAENKLAIKSL